MKFGEVDLDEAEGSFLAHALSAGAQRYKKGTVLGRDEIAALKAAGVTHAIVAQLDAGDVDEDTAAKTLSICCAHASLRLGLPSTGRVNIYAQVDGLFIVSREIIDAINRIDPAITVATLNPFVRVSRGQMVATVKIIPFAVSREKLAQAVALLTNGSGCAFEVAAWRPHRVGLVTTLLPSLKDEVIAKTNRVLQSRLMHSHSTIVMEKRVAHGAGKIGGAIAALAKEDIDLIIVFGASAVVDAHDVIPEGIRLSGGNVIQVGMPVDPGNLLVLGRLGTVPVIGAPGCARSPKENGFDWILDRTIAGVATMPSDFAGMGVGGLLMEIETRPRPREVVQGKAAVIVEKPNIAGLLLAAGSSSRMGGSHKLKALFDGEPLVARSAQVLERALGAAPFVVLGHDAQNMAKLLSASSHVVLNDDFAEGLSTSLRAGMAALDGDFDGVLIHLADMPAVTDAHLKSLCAAFLKADGKAVVRATHDGKRGNPVILPRSLFGQVTRLTGDMGARAIIEGFGGQVIDVELGNAASLDVDTPEALRAAGGIAAS